MVQTRGFTFRHFLQVQTFSSSSDLQQPLYHILGKDHNRSYARNLFVSDSFVEATNQAYREWEDALKVKSSFEVAILCYQELIRRKAAFEQSVEDALKVKSEYRAGLLV